MDYLSIFLLAVNLYLLATFGQLIRVVTIAERLARELAGPRPHMDFMDACVWPDGTWCYREELSEMTHMSNDYKVLPFNSPEHDRLVYDL